MDIFKVFLLDLRENKENIHEKKKIPFSKKIIIDKKIIK